ncbi:MAG: hypothetical protein Q9O62_11170 [Ardenticatenia bacterium]|nr:hypothetical protein [Ardenticatenia bacterium]
MNTLSRYNKTLEQWGLSDIPFRSTPPEDVNKLARIFHGREKELAMALPTLYEGRNVLVRGIWGVGKTAFIRYLLYRLQKESASLAEEMLILYIGRFPGEELQRRFGTPRHPLFPSSPRDLAKQNEPKARQVCEVLSGLQKLPSQPGVQAYIEGKVSLQFVSLGGSWEHRQEKSWQLQNVYRVLLDLLSVAQERYRRVILAVDDLDKKTPRAVLDIIDAATDLLRRGEGEAELLVNRALCFNIAGHFRPDVGPVQRDNHFVPHDHRGLVSHCRQLPEYGTAATL